MIFYICPSGRRMEKIRTLWLLATYVSMRFFMHFWADVDPIFGQKTHSEKRKCWCPFVFFFVSAHGSLYGAIFRPNLRHPGGHCSLEYGRDPRVGEVLIKMGKDGPFWLILSHLKTQNEPRWPILAPKINENLSFLSMLWMKI